MNRLSPMIVRRPLVPAAASFSAPAGLTEGPQAASAPAWLDDLRLFATGWIGGLIFFGTLFG